MRTIKIAGGLGDVIASLPLLEQIPEDIKVQFDPIWVKSGLDRLFMCLPNVKSAVYESFPSGRQDMGTLFFDFNQTLPENYARILKSRTKLIVEPRFTCRNLNLNAEGISEYQIVVHHWASTGLRRWPHWNDVTFPLPVVVSGSKDDPHEFLSNFPFVTMDVYDTAIMMKRSRLSVCVNSSHLHIANILGLRHITIYTHEAHAKSWPSTGISLVNPSALELSNWIRGEVSKAEGSS